ADTALLLAALSSFKNKPLATDLITFGEIGLAGEIRPVPNGQERLREAAKHGFKHAIVPKANLPKNNETIEGLTITPVQRVSELVDTSFN
ncbi:MAG: DNA repair protein RadA, partial [Gammaproteobacteria bacterium]|nr:DNA repair protein RadA [Gammaproteobacteria bacterium]